MTDHVKKPNFLTLKQLGLRENAIICYEALYMLGAQTASKLAESIEMPRTSVYHALGQLEEKGFVKREKIDVLHMVTEFQAIRIDKALESLAVYQRLAVREIIDYQIERSIEQQRASK